MSSNFIERLHSSDMIEAAGAVEAAATEIRSQLTKTIVGQEAILDQILLAMFCGGHTLVEGVPGLAKTLIISTIAQTLTLGFSRIQFTPDLMPSDVTGSEVIQEDKQTGGRSLHFVKGPVFANVILADEINRTPPKTQAALLEAMQEGQVTVGGYTHALPKPFFVLATQNPIEQEGTYPLPEAQLDRFMFLVRIGYPTENQEMEIVKRTTGVVHGKPSPVLGAPECIRIQQLVREVPVADHVVQYALRIVRATRLDERSPKFIRDYVSWGAGPRASQFLILAAKAKALMSGERHVMPHHLHAVVLPVMRHRIMLNFNAQADGVNTDQVVGDLVKIIPLDSAA
ncbi:MAG: MoxR family ATPase [Phycisphaerales bacterium]|nr:MoxR family ATPase [Phycisphaerales bacterium]